jgi:23S rRNA (pseudouridine1915-N3)-methyltransferase
MRLIMAAIGKLRAGPERVLHDRYMERAIPLGRQVGFTPITSWEIPESHARTANERKAQEALTLESAHSGLLKDRTVPLLACDPQGESLSTEAFCTLLTRLRDENCHTACLLIGGPDGLHAPLLKRAQKSIAFGAMTMPHQLVRILLAEQIYRMLTRLCGHPYHR